LAKVTGSGEEVVAKVVVVVVAAIAGRGSPLLNHEPNDETRH